MTSAVYQSPIIVTETANIKAALVWGNQSLKPDSKVVANFIPCGNCKIVKCSSETSYYAARYCIDSGETGYNIPGQGYPIWRFWLSNKEDSLPVELIFDFGIPENISGFEYKPRNDGIVERITDGNILAYEIYVGDEPEKTDRQIFKGQFTGESKMEFFQFQTQKSRYLRLIIIKGVNNLANIADIRFFR